jgi:hypothetical protein
MSLAGELTAQNPKGNPHMKRCICVLASTAALVLTGLQSASATVIAYTNSAAFDAAVTGETSHNFAGIAPAGGFVVANPTVAGVTFTSNNVGFVIDSGSNNNYGVPFFAGQGNTLNDPANMVSVSLGGGFKALAFFYGSYISQNEPYSATLNTGDVFNLSTPAVASDVNFLGFVSDGAAITNVDFTSLAGLNSLDGNGNALTPFGFSFDVTAFDLANPSSVPEPSTWALMVVALTAFAGTRRRNRG